MEDQQHPLVTILGGIVAIAFWGSVISCTKHPDPEIVEGRFLPHVTTSQYCAYMFPDGSIARYDRNGECPAHVYDELEAE